MAWWGKLLGGTFGFMLGGPLGAILGAALGHQYDKGLKALPGGGQQEVPPDQQELNQTAFFTATFAVMGHIAKADGVVTREEIRFAEAVMQQMDLTQEQRQTAINLFGEGKKQDFRLDEVLDQFHSRIGRQRNLIRMFMEIQVQAAYGDGKKHAAEHRILESISKRLGISSMELGMIEQMILASMHFQGRRAGQQRDRGRERPRPGSAGIGSLADAYAMLEIGKSASDSDVRKAYRRMLSRHHPDKLASKGLPEEMMKIAAEKTHQIKQAYEMIKQSRGMR